MRNAQNQIIYIGKAKNLKNRVGQYFLHSRHNQKVALMVDSVCDFEYILTNSESDALLLEANLIKKHKPKYNILLKDDKYFPYIKISLDSEFPKVEITRKPGKEKAKYFGPFLGGVSIRELIQIIEAAFAVRTCNTKSFEKKSRGCLNKFTGKCSSPCSHSITSEDYAEIIKDVVDFLKGNTRKVAEILTNKMQQAAQNELFEIANDYKSKLELIKKFEYLPLSIPQRADLDIFSFVSNGVFGSAHGIFIRDGRIIGSKNFEVFDILMEEKDAFRNFLYNYYLKAVVYPNEICLSMDLELEEYFESAFGKKIKITIPKIGTKLQLITMSKANANEFLTKNLEQLKHRENTVLSSLDILREVLNLEKRPDRIECYDISNISGTDKTASMVVAKNATMERKLYRKFKITSFEGSDDFRAMKEVLTRRLARLDDKDESFSEKPDLIVIDGGKGQLSAVSDLVCGYGIRVISLAKRDEEIFLPNEQEPIRLAKSNLGLRLLQKIRDESHRFALSYHRTLREKRINSLLESISGIGKKRRKNIIEHFQTEKALRDASVDELCKIDGISENIAKKIIEFNKNNN